MSGVCECTCGLLGCAARGRGRTHGKQSTYRDGCTCDLCTAAGTASAKKRHKRTNSTTRATATKYGQQWTGAELEIATRTDLTAREAALMLGRTRKAVQNMRYLCRTDPKFINLLGGAA